MLHFIIFLYRCVTIRKSKIFQSNTSYILTTVVCNGFYKQAIMRLYKQMTVQYTTFELMHVVCWFLCFLQPEDDLFVKAETYISCVRLIICLMSPGAFSVTS
jgi:hypothetical protein